MDTIEPAGVKSAAMAAMQEGAQPDPDALPLNKVLPPRNRGGKRAGAGRKPSRRPAAAAPSNTASPDTGPDEIDAAALERQNNAMALNRAVDALLRMALGEDMHASDKELAGLDAALVAYQEIKGTVPVPIELVLITAYSAVYGAKLTKPTPKLRIYAAWQRVRGAMAAVVNFVRRRRK